jgi:hypothetical protein
VDSPRLVSIGGQSKKLKILTFGWGWKGAGGGMEGGLGDLDVLFFFSKDAWAKGLGGS